MNTETDTAQGCGECARVGRATKAPTTILSSSHVVTRSIPSSPQRGPLLFFPVTEEESGMWNGYPAGSGSQATG